ncbi:MAG: hypothetical protein IKE95_02010 [Methanobrevibacter sp.]|nr:hypothetical protein [Methanobrevibacter sp.]
MTEKRFECDKGSRIIIDNETKLHYIMTLDWECSLITKLLNHFAEENEELKKENERLCNFNLHMLIDEKNKEIEQLKEENKKLHTKIFEMRTNIALNRTEISRETYTAKKSTKEFLNELEKW